MAPKKAAEAGKRKKEMILLEVKKEIIRKHEGGMRLTDLAKEYGRSASTIATILKMKKKITGRDAAKGVTRVSKQRPPVLDEVEKLLLLWIEQKQRAGDIVTEAIICKKAKALHADLNQQPGMSPDVEGFKASRGWFERFKTRSGIHSVVRHGEAASSDVAAAEEFATKFLKVMVSEGYLPQQVFNCNETGLFWKRMPKRTFITEEETSLPGHKPMKDRLTLLFCANASGDLKIKPLLVYHSENPRAFKKHKVNKEQLSVLWRSNPKAWVTRFLFVQWVNVVFGPAVKQYLVDNNLPLKAVLLMDNAPAHPPGLEEVLLEDFNFIKVMFLPPNSTPLLQPMDQQVISNFKKLYTRELFRLCFEMTNRSSLTLHEFWRAHFDIVSGLQIITIAWARVSKTNLNSAWRNLWPDCVVEIASDASAPETTVLEEIVFLGRTMGLEVTEEDVCELVEGQYSELTTEDLVELQKEAMGEQISFEEEETSEEQLSSRELKEACQMWVNLQTFVQQHHPDKALAQRLVDSFDTDIMSPFRGMLKKHQRRQTLERFLQKQP
ncbi:tigger transposable element-derived protein 1-like isoform X3 [Pelobates fuscus]|uniref:tigger transposable element-derived protein 1-like isoform X3 n=1 Tax=Pelobates fuscus TaxID=191477 RepID=UPI002FE4CA1F